MQQIRYTPRNISGDTTRGERGATTSELVALVVLIAALAGGIGSMLPGLAAPDLSGRITATMRTQITAPGARSRSGGDDGSAVHRTERAHSTSSMTTRSHGDAPRLAADDLRLEPLGPHVAWRHGTGSRATTRRGAAAQGTVDWCVACVGAGWRGTLGAGGAGSRGVGRGLLGAEAIAHAHAALASVEAVASAHVGSGGRRAGDGASAQTRITGLVGGEATAEARIVASRRHQEVHVEAGAVAGAVGRVEQRVGLRLAGVALQVTAGAEGFAGAGAKAHVIARHQGPGRVTWDMGAAAGLGLGGGTRLAATIDARELLADRRLVAHSLLGAALVPFGPMAMLRSLPDP